MTRRALLSVYDKTGLAEFGQQLVAQGFELVASGGTARTLIAAGLTVHSVEDVTGFAEILGGRVKTLHPKIHGAILARGTDEHLGELRDAEITPIDLVVCNLYPFIDTVSAPDVEELVAIEQIDIGGVTLLRAAAKNFERVSVVCDPTTYADVLSWIMEGGITVEQRRALALSAFRHTAQYDAAISTWLGRKVEPALPQTITLTAELVQPLRYGENPHQQAGWYRYNGAKPAFSLKQGKALSYNNLVDVTAAWQMPSELAQPCVAIVKHTNPCGMAIGDTIVEAFDRALACDPVSAFGSIIATNRRLDVAFVERLGKLFVEVLVVPGISDEALALMARKKRNCRVLVANQPDLGPAAPTGVVMRSTQDGLLVQTADTSSTDPKTWRVATTNAPNEQQRADLEFAWRVVKHIKSNAIVLVKDGATVGIGAGQTSRVGSVEIATRQAGDKCVGAALASDAFFPFADGVEVAAQAGVATFIQPGGSKRDGEVVAAADRLGVTMTMTGARHFRH